MKKLEILVDLLYQANQLANELGLDCQEQLSDIQDEIALQCREEDDLEAAE